MRPNQTTIDQVQKLDPKLRIGATEDKLWLLQIYPGRATAPMTTDDWRNRGPIFGAPFDKITEKAVALAYFDPEVFYSGEIFQIIEDRNKSFCEVMEISLRNHASEADLAVDDLCGEMGEELAWDAQRSDAASPSPVARKHLTTEEKQILGGDHESQLPISTEILKALPV